METPSFGGSSLGRIQKSSIPTTSPLGRSSECPVPVPFSDFRFEGTNPLSPTVHGAVVLQREFAHTVMSVILDYDAILSRRLDDGMPISARWGVLPNRAMNFF